MMRWAKTRANTTETASSSQDRPVRSARYRVVKYGRRNAK